MRKTLLIIGGWIVAGFVVGWSGLPILGATVVTVALLLSPVTVLAAAQDRRVGGTS